jgi:signal transduction histidine kinase
VRDARGDITGIEGAFQDITERKEAEQAHASLEAQLRESQKMEAIGTLAGGIAHDFNNILGTILGNVELARQDAASNWQALVSLEEIQKAGHRARDLVQQILSFSRRQPTTRRVMSLSSTTSPHACCAQRCARRSADRVPPCRAIRRGRPDGAVVLLNWGPMPRTR